jgi:hypothetical protein
MINSERQSSTMLHLTNVIVTSEMLPKRYKNLKVVLKLEEDGKVSSLNTRVMLLEVSFG